jgi:hypothetical protein
MEKATVVERLSERINSLFAKGYETCKGPRRWRMKMRYINNGDGFIYVELVGWCGVICKVHFSVSELSILGKTRLLIIEQVVWKDTFLIGDTDAELRKSLDGFKSFDEFSEVMDEVAKRVVMPTTHITITDRHSHRVSV